MTSKIRFIILFFTLICPAFADLVDEFTFDGGLTSATTSNAFTSYGTNAFDVDHRGHANGAVLFDGSTYLVSNFSDTTIFGSGTALVNSMAITLRVDEIPSSPNTFYIHATSDSGGYDGRFLYVLSVKAGSFLLTNRTTSGSHKNWEIEGPSVEIGKYYRIVVRWDQDNQTAAMFVNGEKFDTISLDGILTASNYTDGGLIRLGADRFLGNVIPHFSGAIDSLAYYDHAWTDDEVATDNTIFALEVCCASHEHRIGELESALSAIASTLEGLSDQVSENTSAIANIQTQLP